MLHKMAQNNNIVNTKGSDLLEEDLPEADGNLWVLELKQLM